MGRGSITPEIKAKTKELLGVEDFTQQELRLLVYVLYVMVNEQRIKRDFVNPGERLILSGWCERGWISESAGFMQISKKFWDVGQQIIWLGYVVGNDPAAELKTPTETDLELDAETKALGPP